MTLELTKLKEQIKKSNPVFTEHSLRRTIEVIIINIKGLGFMDVIEKDEIEKVVNEIPKEWNIVVK